MPHLRDLPALLDELRSRNLYRDPDASSASTELVDFSANDTLGLARGGVSRETSLGSGAARAVFGSHRAHLTTERYLREWLAKDAALLFSSGYAANVGALSALLGPDDLVLSDALNHASLIDGIRLSRAQVHIFAHLDLAAAANWVEANPPRGAVWLVLESYYSMDGDSPDLVRARELCDAHGWNLYLDEAHAFGLFGPEGRGLAAAQGVNADVMMLGFGKAIGAAGAAIVSAVPVRQWLWNRARALLFSTAPSPYGTEVLQSQLERARRSDVERGRVQEAASSLRAELIAAGWRIVPGSHGPILSLLLGESDVAQRLAKELELRGVRAQAIRPPTVPAGTSRVRLILSSRHTPEELSSLRSALVELAPSFRPGPLATPQRPAADSRRARDPRMPRPRRILVLGTGTGIGKTYFAARLVELLAALGERVLGLKPVESGLTDAPPGETDWETLGRAGLQSVPPRYAFSEPLSPHLCAARTGQTIDPAELVAWVDELEHRHEPTSVVLETAGGAFSPLSLQHSNAHTIGLFRPDSVVLVAPDRLGVLHEVEVTLRALHQLQGAFDAGPLRVPVDGVVLSGPATPDSSTGLNAAELREIVLPKFCTQNGTSLGLVPVARNGSLRRDDTSWLLGRE